MRKKTHRFRPSARYFYIKYIDLKKQGNEKEAKRLLLRGANFYPEHYALNLASASYYIGIDKWNKSIKHYERVIKNHSPIKEHIYVNYCKALKKDKRKKQYFLKLQKGIKQYPLAYSLYEALFDAYIKEYDWNEAINTYNIMKKKKVKIQTQIKVKRAMLFQIKGDYKSAEQMYESLFTEQSSGKYSKIEIFNNGESSIEFYKRHTKMSTVCLTFDSINITWNQEPFAFRMLKKENLDIISLRRRRADSYHQDLTIEDYVGNTKKLANYYERKIAYGFSLGAYTSLYYAANIDAQVLSISPRNSTHPIFGVHQESKERFNHEIGNRKNSNIQPIIVYDPKNRIDSSYIETELKVKYPQGVFMEFPYAGHRIAPYFKQVGILKEVIQAVINKSYLPTRKEVDNNKSYQYLRVLGEACFSRCKLNWAYNLANKALEINSKDLPSHILKIRVLIEQKRYDDVLRAINIVIEKGVNDKKIMDVKQLLELINDNKDNKVYKELLEKRLSTI